MRPILNTKVETNTKKQPLVVRPSTKTTTGLLVGARLEARIKQSRSRTYVGALTRLDAGAHATDVTQLEHVIAALAEEFTDLDVAQRPLGIVQKCILGPEYEVHILDPAGDHVVRHFTVGEAMPPLFERARPLAIHPGRRLLNTYAFVEVFADRLVAVRADGPVTSVDPTGL